MANSTISCYHSSVVSVKIDEEILAKFHAAFGNKKPGLGDVVQLDDPYREDDFWYGEDGVSFMPVARDLTYYDNQFTKWLKENRPEIFI